MSFRVYFSDDRTEYYDACTCELHLTASGTATNGEEIVTDIVGRHKKVLDLLIENQGIPVSRCTFHISLDCDFFKRSPVDLVISELKKKLGKYASFIKTVRGVGYKYIGPRKENTDKSFANPSCSDHQDEQLPDFVSNSHKSPESVFGMFQDIWDKPYSRDLSGHHGVQDITSLTLFNPSLDSDFNELYESLSRLFSENLLKAQALVENNIKMQRMLQAFYVKSHKNNEPTINELDYDGILFKDKSRDNSR